MNFPTTLTAIRIALIPILVIVLLTQFEKNALIALGIFLFAALTDLLDGLLARKKKQESVLGQLLDPIADKLLITATFICLVELNLVSAWMVIIIIGREMTVTGFRVIASSKGIHIPASALGKIKMDSEIATISLLILGEKYLGSFYFLTQVGLWIVIISALGSAAIYFIKFGPKILSSRS